MRMRQKSRGALLGRWPFLPLCLAAICVLFVMLSAGLARSSPPADSSNSSQNPNNTSDAKPPMPRGKKLILKDGNVQMVREYQIIDDRVRFYSTERSQWEEMPVALVDWDATKQSEVDQKKGDQALLTTVHKQEQARRIMPLDVDASLEAAPGVFIPPGEGMFVYDGKSVLRLTQAQADNKLAKAQEVAVILTPIHVIPSRRNITLHKAHAEVRVHNEQPEFYMRTADLREPNMLLIHTKVHGETRLIQNADTYFQAVTKMKRNEVPAQRWQIANGVYRFTIGQSLEPGEYVFIEIVKGEGTDLYVWDFGVESAGKSSSGEKQSARQ